MNSTILRHLTIDKVACTLITLSGTLVFYEAATRTSLNDAQNARECRYPPLGAIVTEAHVRQLERDDVVVIKNVLTTSQLSAARRCAERLGGEMSRTNHGNDGDVRQDLILSIREKDNFFLRCDDEKKEEKGCREEEDDGMVHCIKLLRGIPFLLHRFGYSSSQNHVIPLQCQLARYRPDGSVYVRHLDRCDATLAEMGLLGWLRASDYRHRVVTAILYLNSRHWDKGGELRCYVGGRHRDVVPAGGTLVLFNSSTIEHQVFPSSGERYALTCWFNGVLT